LKSIVFKIADIGWSGVDLFFVLSGYLVTGILLRYKKDSRPVLLFMIRRFLRILPPYYLALVLVFFFVPLALQIYEIPAIKVQLPYWLYTSNYFDAINSITNGWFILSHFWSLAVEMQFYVLWPFVIYHCSLKTVQRVAFVTLIIALIGRTILVFAEADWIITYEWLPWRIDGLVIGSLVATYLYRESNNIEHWKKFLHIFISMLGVLIFLVAWFGLAGSVFKSPENIKITVLRITLPLLLSLFYGGILLIALQENLLSRVLGSNPFKLLAQYSYGIYIIHFLLVPIFERYFHPRMLALWVGGADFPIYLYFIICSTISFLLAMTSYHLFEIRFLQLKSTY
jgi:peptidoglycan/LPS O-acetylase OafA/YrhL